MESRAQTATEYLLLLGGALAVLAIITVLALNTIGTGQTQTGCNFDSVKSNIPVAPDGVKITSPTACKKAIMTSFSGGSGSGSGDDWFAVKFDVGPKVSKYSVTIKSQISGAYFCDLSNQPVPPNATSVTHYCYPDGSEQCGTYDVVVSAYDLSNKLSESATEKGAVVVKFSGVC